MLEALSKVFRKCLIQNGIGSAGKQETTMLAPALTPSDQSAVFARTTYRLLSPCLERCDGTGQTIDLGLDHASLLLTSMGINHVIENERLTLSIWGSVDGNDWGDKPLVSFPPKAYCGVYSTFLNLAAHPHVRYLRAKWNMVRCGHAYGDPLFGFYASVQESSSQLN
jgi:hypothetical protein